MFRINCVLVINDNNICCDILCKFFHLPQSFFFRFCCGYLLGRILATEIKIYDLLELDLTVFENVDVTTPPSDLILSEFASIRASVPVGIDFVGVFITQPENGNLEVCKLAINFSSQFYVLQVQKLSSTKYFANREICEILAFPKHKLLQMSQIKIF